MWYIYLLQRKGARAFEEPEHGREFWFPCSFPAPSGSENRFLHYSDSCLTEVFLNDNSQPRHPHTGCCPWRHHDICLLSDRSQIPSVLHPAPVLAHLQSFLWILSPDSGTKPKHRGTVFCCLLSLIDVWLLSPSPRPSSNLALETSVFLSTNRVSKG